MKLVFLADLPDDKYDFIVAGHPRWVSLLQAEIDERFKLVEQVETRDTGEVVVIKRAD